jgi:diamine N-acetyltransferase
MTGMNLHYAIIDQDDDVYLGTVSLKNIDIENGTAEYAIVVRREAQGHGVAHKATELILKKAFFEIGLRRVYLSVYSNNYSAIKLYEKCGFKFEGEFRNHFIIENEYVGWKWYGILKEEYNGDN